MENYTLGRAFEEVLVKLENSKLTEEAFASVGGALSFIQAKLEINTVETFILAVMLNTVGSSVDTEDFATFADVTPIRILDFQKDFDNLINRGMIRCLKQIDSTNWQHSFELSVGMVQAVRYNKEFVPLSYKDLSPQDVLDMMAGLLDDCDYDRIKYTQLLESLEKLISETQHVELCRKIKELDMHHSDMVIFLIAVVSFANKDDDCVYSSGYDDILPKIYQRRMVRNFKRKRGFLCEHNLVEATDDDFDAYRLTLDAKRDFLQEFEVDLDGDDEDDGDDEGGEVVEEVVQNQDDREVPKEEIVLKKMFYNKEEELQIERLRQLLDNNKFEEVQMRMRSVGMRPGFASLFYGSPGTGKTETVFQLARATGREVIMVNIASLRNCYVGESEKNIQRVFDEYKEKKESGNITPILFFNEADGIFGKRYTGVNDAADQIENTIQNIILQNMETFEGILIATTNLTANFDKAFERRFLYKIEFKKPKRDVRMRIWLSVIPELSENDASILAAKYAFSGAQIENIARKQMIDSILYNRPLSLEFIKQLCDEEIIKSPLDLKKLSA